MHLHLNLELSDFNYSKCFSHILICEEFIFDNEKCVISMLCIFNYCYILPTLGCCNKAQLSDLHLVVVWGGGGVGFH